MDKCSICIRLQYFPEYGQTGTDTRLCICIHTFLTRDVTL